MNTISGAASIRPWYREFWPWLLMLPPLFAVVGGVVMIWLAIGTPNALVVEDYARIEELTGEQFERDRQALRLGLTASLSHDPDTGSVELTLSGTDTSAFPDSLILSLRHIVEPAADIEVELLGSGSVFTGRLSAGAERYHLELLPPDRSWRLGSGPQYLGGELQLLPQQDNR